MIECGYGVVWMAKGVEEVRRVLESLAILSATSGQ
jgi:hypothetical protein